MAQILHPTSAEFEKMVAEDKRLIVADFYADWCGPCKLYAPQFELAAHARPEVVFVKIDTDKLTDIAKKYGVSSIPTTIIYKKGRPADQFLGYKPVEKVLEVVDKHA